MTISLDEIQTRLSASIDGGSIRLPVSAAQELGFFRLPTWLLPNGTLTLDEVSMIRVDKEHLELRSHHASQHFGGTTVCIRVCVDDGSLRTDVDVALKSPKTIADFASSLGLEANWLIERVGSAALVEALTMRLRTTPRNIELRLRGGFKLQGGVVDAELALHHLTFDIEPFVWQELRGTLRLSALDLPVRLSRFDELHLELPELSVERTLRAFEIGMPPLPSLPFLSEPIRGLSLSDGPEGLRLSGVSTISGLGKLRFAAAVLGSRFEVVIAVDADPELGFSSVSPALRPLDALMSVVSFGQPAFILSSVTTPSFPFPDAEGRPASIAVRRGAEFLGDVKLSGFGLDVLKGLLGTASLPFRVPAQLESPSLLLIAELREAISLFGILTIERLQLILAPQPVSASVEGDASLTLGGMRLPPLVFGMSLGAGSPAFELKSKEAWEKPLGLPFDVQQFGLQISPGPPTECGFFGTIRLGKRQASLATKILAGQIPTFLDAQLEGEFELAALIADLLGLPPPPLPLGMTVRDARLYLVVEPQGARLGGRTYPQGIMVAGTTTFLGFGGTLALHGGPTRAHAEGALTGPIRLQPFFALTGPDGAGPPSFQMDTQATPVMQLSGRLELAGMTQEVQGVVGVDCISFRIEQQAGPVGVEIDCTLSNGVVRAEGEAGFGLKTSLGPIRLFPGGPNLGRINIDARCVAHTSLAISADGKAEMIVAATFNVLGVKIPSRLQLSAPSYERIPDELIRHLHDHAAAIFAELLQVDNWLKALAQGVIDGVDDAARALKEHFHKGAAAIAAALHQLEYGAEKIVLSLDRLSYTPAEVVKAMSGLTNTAGDLTHEVTRVLIKGLNKPADAVAEAWRAVEKPAGAVKEALVAAGVPAAQVTDAIGRAFPDITVSTPFLKVDKPFLKVDKPFLKVGKPFGKLHLKRFL